MEDKPAHTPIMVIDRLYWDARYVLYQQLEEMEDKILKEADDGEYKTNLLCGLNEDLSNEKYASLGVAINISCKKTFTVGSTCGFRIGNKHFTIIRTD